MTWYNNNMYIDVITYIDIAIRDNCPQICTFVIYLIDLVVRYIKLPQYSVINKTGT